MNYGNQPPQFPEDMGVPEFNINKPGPSNSIVKEVSYHESVDKLTAADQTFAKILMTLFEFGYGNFDKNLELARKHKGDINLIINDLVLSDSEPVQAKPVQAKPVQPKIEP